MKRVLAAMLAAMIVSGPLAALPARAGEHQAPGPAGAEPFERVPLPPPPSRPHRAAYACLTAGAGLMAASFVIAHRADRAYDAYLLASRPGDIERLFDDAARNDRWSSGALLAGEALLATGIYLRFLRRSAPVSLALAPDRCVVSVRF